MGALHGKGNHVPVAFGEAQVHGSAVRKRATTSLTLHIEVEHQVPRSAPKTGSGGLQRRLFERPDQDQGPLVIQRKRRVRTHFLLAHDATTKSGASLHDPFQIHAQGPGTDCCNRKLARMGHRNKIRRSFHRQRPAWRYAERHGLRRYPQVLGEQRTRRDPAQDKMAATRRVPNTRRTAVLCLRQDGSISLG